MDVVVGVGGCGADVEIGVGDDGAGIVGKVGFFVGVDVGVEVQVAVGSGGVDVASPSPQPVKINTISSNKSRRYIRRCLLFCRR